MLVYIMALLCQHDALCSVALLCLKLCWHNPPRPIYMYVGRPLGASQLDAVAEVEPASMLQLVTKPATPVTLLLSPCSLVLILSCLPHCCLPCLLQQSAAVTSGAASSGDWLSSCGEAFTCTKPVTLQPPHSMATQVWPLPGLKCGDMKYTCTAGGCGLLGRRM